VCRLDPYPLRVEPYRARIPCVRIPRAQLPSIKELWAAGGNDTIDITFVAA
jgi:hypothetical protein